jgi:protein-disulfide isomerase
MLRLTPRPPSGPLPRRRARRVATGIAAFGALLGAWACAKKSAEVPAASAAPAKGDDKAAGGGGAEDTTPPPGVDLTKLDEFERKVFFRVVNKEASACGKAESLIRSVKNDKACRKSFYAVRYVARLVDSGYTDSEIGEHLQKRFRAGPPKTLELGEAPMKGSATAPVAVVEFVDYECPHCKRVQPVLRQVLEEFPNEVKVYFKHYPLGQHTNARLAAEAAVAAHRQGKFWAFNDKVWASSDSLTPAALEQIAKDVGLDVARWRKDLESNEVKARVQKDKDEGNALGIQATPTIYINGRTFSDTRDVDSLRDWINEDLGK